VWQSARLEECSQQEVETTELEFGSTIEQMQTNKMRTKKEKLINQKKAGCTSSQRKKKNKKTKKKANTNSF
jgi:hypothetical protein